MTPPINPKTKKGKERFIGDVILSMKGMLKTEKNGRRIELKKAKDLFEEGLIHLKTYQNEL